MLLYYGRLLFYSKMLDKAKISVIFESKTGRSLPGFYKVNFYALLAGYHL
jgi:hypothetical protein